MNNKIKNIIPVAILIFLVSFIFWDIITVNKMFITGDIDGSDLVNFNYPVREFLGNSLHNKSLPLWCPYIYNGFPLNAEGQGGFFYPPNFILYALFSPQAACNYSIVLNFFLSGLFFFIFAKSIKTGRWGALIGAIAYMFSGFFIAHLKHMNMVNVAAWIPLLLYFVEMFFRKYNIKYAVLMGIVLALQFLAGHPQIVYYSMIVAIIYSIFKVLLIFLRVPTFFSKTV